MNEYTQAVCARWLDCALYQLFVLNEPLQAALLRASPYPPSAPFVPQMQLLFCFCNFVSAGAVPDGNENFLQICEMLTRLNY